MTQKYRRYTHKERVIAVLAADMTSNQAAAEAMGINESTVRSWRDRPEFAELRVNARAGIAEEAMIVARLAWQALGDAIRAGTVEPRDLILAAGTATDKTLLLKGEATARTETVTLTDAMDDHERAALRAVLDAVIAEVPA